MNKPLFSIIVAQCDSVIPDEVAQRFFDSLKAQTFKDFEIVLMHDGPRTRPFNIDFGDLDLCMGASPTRECVGGDNLRTPGMKLANGKFFINTNIDNVYYPDALENWAKAIQAEPFIGIFISSVKMMGLSPNGGGYDSPRDYSKYRLLRGVAPVVCNIDIMNLVAERSLYEAVGYWFVQNSTSDGTVYQKLCETYGWRHTETIVGEHY
jgi:hypothetical protein